MADNKSQRRHYYTTYDTTSCYTKASKYCTKAPGYYITTYAALSYYTESPEYFSSPSYTTKGSITTRMLQSTTPPKHRSTIQPHIMGKYSVKWSFIMPRTKYTNYSLPSSTRGEKRWNNSAAEWTSPSQQQELPCTILSSTSFFVVSQVLNKGKISP